MNSHAQMNVLARLAATIEDRAASSDRATSYTARLLAAGKQHCARKFGEESVELIIAGLGSDRDETISEAADVVYHLLVLLQANDIRIDEVLDALEGRFGRGGLDEKASRADPD